MGFRISSYTLIKAVSLAHLTAAYLLLYRPHVLAEQNVVVILGESMQVNSTSAFSKPTEVTALASILLAFLGVSDLIAASLPERSCLEYWSNILPFRLFMLFSSTGYIYLTRTDDTTTSTLRALKGNSSPLDLVKNSFVFTFLFMETLHWFWVFVAMKEDRREWMVREATAQLREEEEKKFRM
ncbi:hypothetical protein E4T42_07561 [Aureobasidium subglaciale]|uniref:Increased loss of mitochondrial DNA protein 1 n=1 Tax=Aureobasidium subglaciale (strain EXF-2481) TaxID=1043005 RepID=A0A074Y661_AURSE|nr:uncharacterized protein AUEXF2481DRAFT_6806 [Aureobasidium subglaciale EXF-2481]KAI5199810.1 hypothetical protein E4T38_06862 [Aureobasidium subglaciale]KAI5218761.1 hypothetical protein E4T40_06728 [Aureobasidium subglaciale]KAI5222340.1 hypothetical protein E4T41_06713 [Aureobasidium subglaciale]KAI5242908.1 hypothetical protein E4T42_07561 [Aureobasidium subglaciale]KAI5259809.1 hypothetical protein E4T46_06534 [Aureobasidium subglaciale]